MRSDTLTRTAYGLIGDLAECFSGGLLKQLFLSKWVANELRSRARMLEETRKTMRWAREVSLHFFAFTCAATYASFFLDGQAGYPVDEAFPFPSHSIPFDSYVLISAVLPFTHFTPSIFCFFVSTFFILCLILSLSLSIQHMHAIYIFGLIVINLSRRYTLKLRIACNKRTDLYGCPTSTHNNVVISTFFVWPIFFLPTTRRIQTPFSPLLSSSSPRANRYYF